MEDNFFTEIAGCYICKTQILRDAEAGEKPFAAVCYKNGVVPTKDYTCIDVFLSDGKRIVAYAVPVCRACCAKVINERNATDMESLRRKIISMVFQGNIGPEGFLKPDLDIWRVDDLTETLMREGIICQ